MDYAISCGCDIQKHCKILFTIYSAVLVGGAGVRRISSNRGD